MSETLAMREFDSFTLCNIVCFILAHSLLWVVDQFILKYDKKVYNDFTIIVNHR